MSDMFCLISDVKRHLADNDSWTDRDDIICAYIEMATQAIKNYTRRNWIKKIYVQVFNTPEMNGFLLHNNIVKFYTKEIPLLSSTSPVVKFSTSGNFTDADPLTEDDDYFVDYDNNYIGLYASIVKYNPRSVQITYEAGFTKGTDQEYEDFVDVTPDLRNACALQAAFMFRKSLDQDNAMNEKSSKRGNMSYALKPSGLSPEAQSLIKQYARILVGSM